MVKHSFQQLAIKRLHTYTLQASPLNPSVMVAHVGDQQHSHWNDCWNRKGIEPEQINIQQTFKMLEGLSGPAFYSLETI